MQFCLILKVDVQLIAGRESSQRYTFSSLLGFLAHVPKPIEVSKPFVSTVGRKSVRLPRELMERVIYYDMHWSLGPIPRRRRGILCLCSRKTVSALDPQLSHPYGLSGPCAVPVNVKLFLELNGHPSICSRRAGYIHGHKEACIRVVQHAEARRTLTSDGPYESMLPARSNWS